MPGRFLEISVHANDVLESLQFYEALGFRSITVGEVWPYPYAVMTDGRLYLGLHQQPLASPTVTFVQRDLSAHAQTLRKRFDFDYEHLGIDEFHEVGWHDPGDCALRLLEARTFSPPPAVAADSACGYFLELSLYAREPDASRRFWELLGFIALEEEATPFKRIIVTSDHLNIGLHNSRGLRQPVLAFESSDMAERLARLRERGFKVSDDMPEALDERSNGVLIAPEGTRLLLMQTVL